MLHACKDRTYIDEVKCKLKFKFEMKDLEPAKKILRMKITRDRKNNALYLSQKSYISKILARFDMNGFKTVSILIRQHFKLLVEQAPKSESEKGFYE